MVNYKQQLGVALISVLFIVALTAILATQMTGRLQLQMQRATNIHLNQQAYWYAMGAEAFAKSVLIESFKKDDSVTHLKQVWAQGETTFPVDDGEITGEITDLQSCFNLNALRVNKNANNSNGNNPAAQNGNNRKSNKQGNNNQQKGKVITPKKAFQELILILGIEGVDNFAAESMTDALSDWLDADSGISSTGGAEDNDYSAKEFPYLAANHYLASINELRIIEHFTLPVIEKLKEYVCVLPNTNMLKINVNTITSERKEILSAMLGISKSEASQVISGRDEKGFKTVDDFFRAKELNNVQWSAQQKDQFTVKSTYFNFKTKTSFNQSYFSMNTILKVASKDNINAISRIIGKQ